MNALAENLALAAETATVDLCGVVTADAFEAAFSTTYQDINPSSSVCMNFDFSNATVVEPVALQMVIAAMLAAVQAGNDLVLRIPQEKRLRDFWRAWGFPQAVNAAIGANIFHSIAHSNDHKFFGEAQSHYGSSTLPAHPGFEVGTPRSLNYFGFHTMKVDPEANSTRLAYEEKDSWSLPHIQAVLENMLGRDANYFPSRVAFEAVLNALRHPDARIIQTASRAAENKKLGDSFVAHFWDDGSSMADTLALAIANNTEIRVGAVQDFRRKYLLVESNDDNPDNVNAQIVDDDLEITKQTSQSKLLFATILPGITSDPTGPHHFVPDEVLQEDSRYGGRGMGLFVLINAMVEVLGGSVAFRTGCYFMNVRKTKQSEFKETGASLRVRIKERPVHVPPFRGNLVTVRLRRPKASSD
jgi:hypothetical protein